MAGNMNQKLIKIGVAGTGALGSIVAKALMKGMNGYELIGVSDIKSPDFTVPLMSFEDLADKADMVVECLPPAAVPALAKTVLAKGKTLILISACTVILYPDILHWAKKGPGRIIVPSGALVGLDAVAALREGGIASATIRSTKPPKAFVGAPYVARNQVNLGAISEKTLIFSGNAYEAADAFPANVNVAASLSLAGIGPDKTQVEVWADPAVGTNSHEIEVKGGRSTITARVENLPDPANPKSSTLAAYSILSTLRKLMDPIANY